MPRHLQAEVLPRGPMEGVYHPHRPCIQGTQRHPLPPHTEVRDLGQRKLHNALGERDEAVGSDQLCGYVRLFGRRVSGTPSELIGLITNQPRSIIIRSVPVWRLLSTIKEILSVFQKLFIIQIIGSDRCLRKRKVPRGMSTSFSATPTVHS